MSYFASAIEIGRPVEEVYAWFLDVDKNAPRIDPEADEARKVPSGETKAGATFFLRSGGRESLSGQIGSHSASAGSRPNSSMMTCFMGVGSGCRVFP